MTMMERDQRLAPSTCQGVGDRSFGGLAGDESRVLHHAQQHDRHADIKNGADDQRGDDAEGQVALRIARFLGRGGNRIETDVGEEDDGASGDDAAEPGGRKRLPVAGIHQRAADHQEDQNGADLDRDHDVVGFGGFADAAHQQNREDEDDEEGRER